MEWLYIFGIVVFAVLFLVVQSFGHDDTPAPEGENDLRDYRWGDETFEYSYRHPWDDEI